MRNDLTITIKQSKELTRSEVGEKIFSLAVAVKELDHYHMMYSWNSSANLDRYYLGVIRLLTESIYDLVLSIFLILKEGNNGNKRP